MYTTEYKCEHVLTTVMNLSKLTININMEKMCYKNMVHYKVQHSDMFCLTLSQ